MTSKPRKEEAGKTKRDREQEAWANEGGYMAAKIQKLIDKYGHDKTQPLQPGFVNNSPQIFNGVSIFVNGYTEPSFDVLRQLMIEYGGTFEHYYSASRVTHIVATGLAFSKHQQFANKKVVLPTWITESVDQKRLLPFENYLLLRSNTIATYFGSKSAHDEGWEGETSGLGDAGDFHDRDKVVDIEKDSLKWEKDSSNAPLPNQKCGDGLRSHLETIVMAGAELHPKKSAAAMLSADSEGFVAEFYGNSRLHHISQWRTDLRDLVQEIRSNPDHRLTGRERLMQKFSSSCDVTPSEGHGRMYMHVDMDCFFVSVGLRNHPELNDKPVVVAHSKGNPLPQSKHHGSMSEIASCNYLARQAGIRNGMMMGKALKLCPNLMSLPYDFNGYSEVSVMLYKVVASYTSDIEAVSCDELYADITSLLGIASVHDIVQDIRKEITGVTGCCCSAGVGSNLLLARLATKKAKPNGQHVISDEQTLNFLENLPISELPGVGYATSRRLQQLNVGTCSELQRLSLALLKQEFGAKAGESLYNLSRGKDDRMLKCDSVRQSVSCDVNYGIRLTEQGQVDSLFKNISAEVSKKLQNAKLLAKQLTLKIKVRAVDAPVESAKYMGHGICDSLSKSSSLRAATAAADMIHIVSMNLWKSLNISVPDLRGVGIQMTKLEPLSSRTDGQMKLTDIKSMYKNAPNKEGMAVEPLSAMKRAMATASLPYQSAEEPRLCGLYDSKDICRFIEMWSSFSPDSLATKDKEKFTHHVRTLVHEHYLDVVWKILVHIKWISRNSSAWKEFHQEVLSTVNDTVSLVYGFHLDLPV